MLKHVTATLEALHLLQPGRELHYSLNITIGEAISISAFDSATHFFQIKASEFIDLTHEYAAYQRAWSAFPDFVPRPLGYATRAGWHIMISEGIFHTHFPAQLIALYEQAPQGPAADLMRFFAIGRQQILDASATSNALLLEQLESYFAATPHAQLAARWLQFARQQGVQAIQYFPIVR